MAGAVAAGRVCFCPQQFCAVKDKDCLRVHRVNFSSRFAYSPTMKGEIDAELLEKIAVHMREGLPCKERKMYNGTKGK